MQQHVAYFEIAGITIRVESDLPITEATFAGKFAHFRAEGPGDDTVVIRHHFGLPESVPGFDEVPSPQEVYCESPWRIYRTRSGWIYLGIAAEPDDPTLHRVAVFSADHCQGEIYNDTMRAAWWRRGGLHSLTMFPSDQVLIARLLADRHGCYLHSGGLTIDGHGLLFVGHSDAGKSTTMQLVRSRMAERVEILCDDRNIVRRMRGGFRVYGTWSHGDLPDVSSASAPLRAVLFLEQAPHNELVPLTDRREAWQRLLATVIRPLVTADWWRGEIDLLEQLIAQVPLYLMRFDKSGDIVRLLEEVAR